MLYFSKFRIISVILISLFFILIASSNLFKFENNLLNKKINLGLDLQGGSYLLLEIDNNPVIEQKIQNLSITIRNYFKDKNIRIKNLNETKYLAKVFSLKFTTPLFISLKGEIGTGKTTFANFFVNHLSEKKTKVLSPTFPIVNIYKIKKNEII